MLGPSGDLAEKELSVVSGTGCEGVVSLVWF